VIAVTAARPQPPAYHGLYYRWRPAPAFNSNSMRLLIPECWALSITKPVSREVISLQLYFPTIRQ
jgi:hypothetical protein